MPRLKYLLLFPILVFTNSAYCQSLESILESHFKIVGQAKLLEANSIVAKGTLVQSGIDIELVTYNKRPDKFRLEGRVEDLTFVEVYDGIIGWTFNQLIGDEQPTLIGEAELELLKTNADFDGILYNYKEKGYTIELLEPENVGNLLTDVIMLSKESSKIKFFLESESGIILKSTTTLLIAGVERVYESVFKDYRYVEEILFPFSVDVYIDGELIMNITIPQLSSMLKSRISGSLLLRH
jgi:hypothetical protein